jgi:hypothetical protein
MSAMHVGVLFGLLAFLAAMGEGGDTNVNGMKASADDLTHRIYTALARAVIVGVLAWLASLLVLTIVILLVVFIALLG